MWHSMYFSVRSFFTNSYVNAKLGNVMRKVLGQRSKRKKIFSEVGVLPTAEVFSKGSCEGRYSGNARRVAVLNKLFMKYITDLLATGEYASDFVGHGMEVTKVQISPDYNVLNVFWISKNTIDSNNIEQFLKKNAGFLKHELSSLRVMGVIPIIQFVKDKQHFQIMELDGLLAKADYGDDYIPTKLETKLKTELELFVPLSPKLKHKLQEMDYEDNEIEGQPLPPMPHDVLGLKHSEILNRIKKNMKKSEALHRANNATELKSCNENPVEFINNKERREAFKQFLEKRDLLRSKARKSEKKYYPDMEYLEQEFNENRMKWVSGFEETEDEKDFIFDDEAKS